MENCQGKNCRKHNDLGGIVTEFNLKYFKSGMMRAQQTKFLNLKQGQMTVTEIVRKFEELERLCQFLQLNEGERVRRMLETFRPEIAIFVETSGLLATMAQCYERAFCAEFSLNDRERIQSATFMLKKEARY